MLHLDRTEEWNLVCRMLETLKKNGGKYTIKDLSGILGFSTYSKHFQKLPIWIKLQNEAVFTPTGKTNSGAVIYYFDWNKLKEVFVNCNMVERAIKATKGRINKVIGR